MQKFDKNNLNTIRHDMEQVLATVAAQHGIVLKLGTITYDATTFSVTLKSEIKDLPIADTKEGRDWVTHASNWGFTADMLGTVFSHNGKRLQIIGYLRDCSTNVVSLRDMASGKKLKCSPAFVKGCLA